MRASLKLILPTLAASLLLSACGSSSSSSGSSAASQGQPASAASSNAPSVTTVKTASSSALAGTVLVNTQGMTLYRLSGEHAGKFICTSTVCLQNWHPLTVSSGAKPSGSVGSLGVVKRPGGIEQVTYKGMPLYTFAADQAPGQAKGQGIKDVGTWNAISAGATKAKATQPTTSTAPASSGSGSYAY